MPCRTPTPRQPSLGSAGLPSRCVPLPSVSVWVWERVEVRRLRRLALDGVRLDMPAGGDRQYAELALLRTLRLERELRRVSFLRQREAMSLLTRSAIESVLFGLFLLSSDEAKGQVAEHLLRMTTAWSPDIADFRAAITPLLEAEEPLPGMPNYRQIAEAVDSAYDFGEYLGRPLGGHL